MVGIQGDRKIHMNLAIQAVMFAFKNLTGLIRLGLIPAILAGAVVYAAYGAIGPIKWPPQSIEEFQQFWQFVFPLNVLLSVCSAVVGTFVAVGIHRLILHGERPAWTLMRIRKYELAYCTIGLEMLVVSYVLRVLGQAVGLFPKPVDFTAVGAKLAPFSVHALFGVIISVILGGLMLWIYMRLILIFPHAALTGEISFRKAWAAIKGNFWRFVGALFLLGLVTMPIYGILVFGIEFPLIRLLGGGVNANASDPISAMLLFGLVSTPIQGLMFSMFIALISYIYRDLVGVAKLG